MRNLLSHILPFAIVFLSAFVLTLGLTPLVREINRKFGMVDKPDPRRINKVPIPRGGGLALFVGLFASFGLFVCVSGLHLGAMGFGAHPLRTALLAACIFALGLADDKLSLRPRLKLLGQFAVAFFAWFWADLGFATLWPWLPVALDGALTVFWIVGAVNAFNLIDGLDGLASGIALIAVLGMAGALIFSGAPDVTLFHFAFAGALLGFLRYNYNPASVFLGDSGSMLIGFLLATLPLATRASNSFLVSVGVPLLAMGVPIFDTTLAIVRRSIRRFLFRREDRPAAAGDSDRVMSADHDHLHHRILRATGLDQRRAAWVLYLMTLVAVLFGLGGMALKSKSGGLWLVAFTVGVIVVFRDMARVELFDAGRLLSSLARDKTTAMRRRRAKLSVPFYIAADILALGASFFVVLWLLRIPITWTSVRVGLPIRVGATFAALVIVQTYATAWGRAMLSNFVRLFAACGIGAVVGSVGVYYVPQIDVDDQLFAVMSLQFLTGFVLLSVIRLARPFVRDLFYALDCTRLKDRKDVSRVLVYGAGLRYRAFRRELIRTTSANDRIIVGLLDDDIVLRGKFIGGLRVLGTLLDAPEVINEVNADAVVIACDVSDEWLTVVRKTLAPTGVKVTRFEYGEREV